MPQLVEMEASQSDQLNKHTAQLEQLREVMNLQRLNKQNALNRRLVRKQQNGSVGQETTEVEDEEDDYIHFGDTVTNVFRGGAEQLQPAPTAPTISTPPPPAPPQSPLEPTVIQQASQALWPIVLASALGAGGLGVGLTSMLMKPAPVIIPTAAGVDTDTGTLYQLEFAEPAELIKGAK